MGNKCRVYESVNDWVNENADKVFRYNIYRKVYTPYEQEKKYIDESMYENDSYEYAFIEDIIELKDDFLIGFRSTLPDFQWKKYDKIYCRLSEVRISYDEHDQIDYEEPEDEQEEESCYES